MTKTLLSYRNYALLVIILSCTSGGHAQLAWDQTEQSLKPDAEATKVTAGFEFTNNGDYPLTIVSLEAPEDCRAVRLRPKDQPYKNTYQPGESGVVLVTHRIGRNQGDYTRTITLTTDERESSVHTLRLDLAAPTLVTLSDQRLVWRVGDEPTPKKVTVTPGEGVDLGEVVAQIRGQGFEVKAEPSPATPEPSNPPAQTIGRVWTLTVTPKSTAEPSHLWIEVETALPEARAPRLMLRALVVPPPEEPKEPATDQRDAAEGASEAEATSP